MVDTASALWLAVRRSALRRNSGARGLPFDAWFYTRTLARASRVEIIGRISGDSAALEARAECLVRPSGKRAAGETPHVAEPIRPCPYRSCDTGQGVTAWGPNP
jgi:hypothetical protein